MRKPLITIIPDNEPQFALGQMANDTRYGFWNNKLKYVRATEVIQPTQAVTLAFGDPIECASYVRLALDNEPIEGVLNNFDLRVIADPYFNDITKMGATVKAGQYFWLTVMGRGISQVKMSVRPGQTLTGTEIHGTLGPMTTPTAADCGGRSVLALDGAYYVGLASGFAYVSMK